MKLHLLLFVFYAALALGRQLSGETHFEPIGDEEFNAHAHHIALESNRKTQEEYNNQRVGESAMHGTFDPVQDTKANAQREKDPKKALDNILFANKIIQSLKMKKAIQSFQKKDGSASLQDLIDAAYDSALEIHYKTQEDAKSIHPPVCK